MDRIDLFLDLTLAPAFAEAVSEYAGVYRKVYLAIHCEQTKWPDGTTTRVATVKVGVPQEEGTTHDATVIDFTAENDVSGGEE